MNLIECLSTFEFRSTYKIHLFFICLFSFYLKILVNIYTVELTVTSAWSAYQSGPLGVPLLDYMIYS